MIQAFILIVVLMIIWQLIAIQNGETEALWVTAKNHSGIDFGDQHKEWTIQRMTYASLIIASVGFTMNVLRVNIWNWIDVLILTSFALVSCFPFWHDGFFYKRMNELAAKLNKSEFFVIPYPGGFKGFHDGKAKFDFKFPIRVFLYFLSFIFIGIDYWILFRAESWQARNVFFVIVCLIVLTIIINYIHGKRGKKELIGA